MKRYEIKHINPSLNWYGIWDNVKREYVVEGTWYCIEAYLELFGDVFDR